MEETVLKPCQIIFSNKISHSHALLMYHWHSPHEEVETVPSPWIWLNGHLTTVKVMFCDLWSYVMMLKWLSSGLFESSHHAVRKPSGSCRVTDSQHQLASHLCKLSSKQILQLSADALWNRHKLSPNWKFIS